jgi:hypothetical protein
MLGFLESLLDEIVNNPEWVAEQTGGQPRLLRLALDSALASLRRQSGERLTSETAVRTLRATVGAVAVNLPLLDTLPAAGSEPARTALTAVLDTLFDEMLNPSLGTSAEWHLARNSSLSLAIELVLDRLARRPFAETHLDLLRDEIRKVAAGDTVLDDLGIALDAALG